MISNLKILNDQNLPDLTAGDGIQPYDMVYTAEVVVEIYGTHDGRCNTLAIAHPL